LGNNKYLSFEKYKIIKNNLETSIDLIKNLTDILNINFKNCWNLGGLLALDEVKFILKKKKKLNSIFFKKN
jgi:hypothetical protein